MTSAAAGAEGGDVGLTTGGGGVGVGKTGVGVLGTRVAEEFLDVSSDYVEILMLHWLGSEPRYFWTQTAAVLTVWTHASIGIHFWLRTKSWYPSVRGALGAVAILVPTLALAGYVSAGNQVHIVQATFSNGPFT